MTDKVSVNEAKAWGKWGGFNDEFGGVLGTIFIMCFFPIFLFWTYISIVHYNGAITAPLLALLLGETTLYDLYLLTPSPTWTAWVVWLAFAAFQAVCMIYLPGPTVLGQTTPTGNRLPYRVNGLLSFFVTLTVLSVCCYGLELFPASILHHQMGPLIFVTSAIALSLVVLLYYKGVYFPTNNDTVQPGHHSILYDMCLGVELNPRIGDFDLKLFLIARCGMIGWTLVDLSHMAAQYEQLGYVTNSMFLVCLFQTIYVVDLLYYEAWYLETIDIMHDRLGFNLTYGAIVWIPFGYTFQTWYLSYNPKDLLSSWFWTLFALGLLGYGLFRNSNNQRRQFRASQGKMKIWGVNNLPSSADASATFMNGGVDPDLAAKCVVAKFTTVDGKQGESLLLTAGYWGLARHFNYLADLLQSFCYCAPCGFVHIVPWQYFIFMVWLLNHRANRDHRRCHQKYGVYWEEYCRRVPYKIIPYVY